MPDINISVRRAVYRMKHLPVRTGLSIPMLYREIKEGKFPSGRKIADNVRIWTEEEVEAEMQRRFEVFSESVA